MVWTDSEHCLPRRYCASLMTQRDDSVKTKVHQDRANGRCARPITSPLAAWDIDLRCSWYLHDKCILLCDTGSKCAPGRRTWWPGEISTVQSHAISECRSANKDRRDFPDPSKCQKYINTSLINKRSRGLEESNMVCESIRINRPVNSPDHYY